MCYSNTYDVPIINCILRENETRKNVIKEGIKCLITLKGSIIEVSLHIMRVMPRVYNLHYHNVIKTASGIVYLKVYLAHRYRVGTIVLYLNICIL